MLFSIGDIASTRTKAGYSVGLITGNGKRIFANATDKRKTFLTYLLIWGCRRFYNHITRPTRTRRDIWIRHSFCAEQFRMITPVFIIGLCVTRLTKCCQIVLGVGIPHILKKTVRDYVMTIERFSCPNITAILTSEVVTLKNRPQCFRPVFSPVRCFFHPYIIA